jgi:hypothetical protein
MKKEARSITRKNINYLNNNSNKDNKNNNTNKDNNEQKSSNGWSKKKEKLLQVWMDECNIYSKLYSYNVIWYEKLDNILGIIGILLSAVTGASLLNNSNNNNPNAGVIILVFGVLSMVNTIIQATKEYLNLKTVINSNLIASRQNKMVCIDIESQLNFSRHERMNGKEFLTSIKDRKNDLILNGPVISNRIWKKITPKYSKYKSNIKDNMDETRKKITTEPSNTYSEEESNDIVYKRRPTIEILNMKNGYDQLNNTVINTDNNIIDIDNTVINIDDISLNTIKEESNVGISVDKNLNIDIDFIKSLNNEEYDTENTSEYTEEDAEEDTFLEEINNSNRANNEINIKLSKKPVNELEQELSRYHL